MLNKLKKGFSLVEVMILFTVLAVILAASMPIVTKKALSVPQKTSHGVYVCIGAGNHTIQRLYNGKNLLNSNDNDNVCTFNVPSAIEYKVELYSAGAGGLNHVEQETVQDNSGTATVELDINDIDTFARTNGSQREQVISAGIANGIPFPTNNQFGQLFDKMYLTIYKPTGKGGDGGTATLNYISSNFQCNQEPPTAFRNDTGYDSTYGKQYKWYYDRYNNKNTGLKNLYNNTNYMAGIPEIKQIRTFCRMVYNVKRSMGYSGLNQNPTDNEVFNFTNQSKIEQTGGKGGKSKDMYLDYKMTSSDKGGSNQYYIKKDSEYPFLHYMIDLVNNKYGHGYYDTYCLNSKLNDAHYMVKQYSSVSLSCTKNGTFRSSNGADKTIPIGDVINPSDNNVYSYLLDNSSIPENSENTTNLVGLIKSYYTSPAVKKIIQSTDGDSQPAYVGFRIPPFNANNNPRYDQTGSQYRTVQTRKATGGKAGMVGVQMNTLKTGSGFCDIDQKETFFWGPIIAPDIIKCWNGNDWDEDSQDFSHNYAYRVFKGTDPYSSEPVPADDGVDAEVLTGASGEAVTLTEKGTNHNDWNYYRIRSTAQNGEPTVTTYPKMIASSTGLMHKKYGLGQAGSSGLHQTFRAPTLGSRCTISLSGGGRVANEEDLRNNGFENLENGLGVNIVCQDTKGNVKFRQSLNGAKYNHSLARFDHPWEPRKKDPTLGVPFEQDFHTEAPMAYSGAAWSNVFSTITRLLDNNRVGVGGAGIYLKDNCNVRNGSLKYQSFLVDENGIQVGGIHHTIDTTYSDGMMNGYACYPDSVRNLSGNDGIRAHSSDDASDNLPYVLKEATAGGPAAVVISW